MDLFAPVLTALIGGAALVLGATLPAILAGRRERRELLERTKTINGKTLAQQIEGIRQRLDDLPTKTDVDRVERKLDQHTDTFGHPKLVEMIANMSEHLEPRRDGA